MPTPGWLHFDLGSGRYRPTTVLLDLPPGSSSRARFSWSCSSRTADRGIAAPQRALKGAKTWTRVRCPTIGDSTQRRHARYLVAGEDRQSEMNPAHTSSTSDHVFAHGAGAPAYRVLEERRSAMLIGSGTSRLRQNTCPERPATPIPAGPLITAPSALKYSLQRTSSLVCTTSERARALSMYSELSTGMPGRISLISQRQATAPGETLLSRGQSSPRRTLSWPKPLASPNARAYCFLTIGGKRQTDWPATWPRQTAAAASAPLVSIKSRSQAATGGRTLS
jgi:hypothetical protein